MVSLAIMTFFILLSNIMLDYSQIISKTAESISSSSEAIEMWEDLTKDDATTNYKEDNKVIVCFPWKCPRTDSKKITCIVLLPSGIVPEEVEFAFKGLSSFQSDTFTLSYSWPQKFLKPEVVFRVDMREDLSFTEKNEFVEFREAIRKIHASTFGTVPNSTITVKLPFMVQRSRSSWSKDIRRFGTSNSGVLSRDKSKKEFISLKEMAKNITSVDHKAYFMIFRFTGVEVEGEDYLDKRSRCIQDCDENSSLSCSDVGVDRS